MAVSAAGVFVGAAGTAAVGDGASSGHAEATVRMVRLAYRLKVDTREDLEWLLIDGSYVKAISTAGQGYRIWILVNWDRMLTR